MKKHKREIEYDKEQEDSSDEDEEQDEDNADGDEDEDEEGDAAEGDEQNEEEAQDEEDEEDENEEGKPEPTGEGEEEDDEDKEDKDIESSVLAAEDAGRSDDAIMRAMITNFTPEQSSRYEYYRRATFQRSNVKRVMQSVVNSPISQTMSIVMGGVTKVFVGEVIESARTIMEEWNESGPIRPRHIREAYRRLKAKNNLPYYPKNNDPKVFRGYR